MRSILLLGFCVFMIDCTFAQLPECDKIYFDDYDLLTGLSSTSIYTYDPGLPTSATNPSVNTIALPENHGGLTVSEVLGSGSPQLTFYTTVDNYIYYYDPATSAWINTNDLIGPAMAPNIAAGGGFIYGLDGTTGSVYQYNGNGDGSLLTSIADAAEEGPYDLIADCEGSFYLLNLTGVNSPVFLRKYNAAGTQIQSWTVNNPNGYSASGGFGIIGNQIYVDNVDMTTFQPSIATGTINATDVTLTTSSPAITLPSSSGFAVIADLGSCASAIPVTADITISTNDSVICDGFNPTFNSTISGGGTSPVYQWMVNGQPVAGANGPNFTFAPDEGDVVSCRLVSNSTCATDLTDTSNEISIDIVEGNASVSYGEEQQCAIGSITPVYEPAGGTFVSVPALSINTTTGEITLSNAQEGSYIIQYTVPATTSCPEFIAYDTLTIVTPNTASISYPGGPFCGEGSALVIQTGATGGIYTATPAGMVIDPATGTIDLEASQPNSYTVTYTIPSNNVCPPGIASTTVVLNSPMATPPIIDAPLHACVGDVIILKGSYPEGDQIQYFWTIDGQNYTGAEVQTSFDVAGSKTLSLYVTSKGCVSPVATLGILIHPHPQPEIIVRSPLPVCQGDTLTLSLNDTAGFHASWAPPSYFSETGGIGTTVLAKVHEPGMVTVRATDQFGCSGTDSFMLETVVCCEVSMPNAFSPNGDGLNDLFLPVSKTNQVVTTFLIFNRFGEQVYSNPMNKLGWDGTYKGSACDVGVYNYYLMYTCANGMVFHKRGTISLIR